MTNPEKTVFISYRRSTSKFIARAVYMDLRANNFDVFMDVESIDSGAFDQAILNQIASRMHFVVILTHGTMERCKEPDDWLRQEIEHAIEKRRNIVPVMVEDFSFDHAKPFLIDKLANLPSHNALKLYHEYFDAAMERLRLRFLRPPQFPVTIEVPPSIDREIIQRKIKEVETAPAPSEEQLSAEEYFQRGYALSKSNDFEGAIVNWEKTLEISPDFGSFVHNNLGYCYHIMGDPQMAIKCYTKGIELNPIEGETYFDRGNVYFDIGEWQKAIKDYNVALFRKTNFAAAYSNRGEAYFMWGNYKQAVEDFKQANELEHHGYRIAIAGLAVSYYALGDLDNAKKYWKALLLRDSRYRDVNWVGSEHHWQSEMIEIARELVRIVD